jgi:hypothetical protein
MLVGFGAVAQPDVTPDDRFAVATGRTGVARTERGTD